MKNRILTLILSLIIIGTPIYAADKQNVTADTYYQITRLSTPTIKIGGRDCKIGDSFKAGEKIDWTDSKQWMLVKNNATKTEVRFSKRASEKKGLLESLLAFLLDRTKGSTRGTYDYIKLENAKDTLSFPERRIAIVVGIQNYHYMAKLKSAQKDAEDISDALEDLGFDVIELYDSDFSELQAGLNKFAGLARNYDIALAYFAAHGVQDNGTSYLLPIDYDPEDKSKGLNNCVSCNSIIQQLENSEKTENSRCKSRIFFFDACRELTDKAAVVENKVPEGKPGSVILFATQSGEKANDGDWDKNSPFAGAFIKNVNRTASFADMMEGLVQDTYYATDKHQYPVRVGSLISDFRFTHKPAEYTSQLAGIQPIEQHTTNETTDIYKDMSAEELFNKAEDYYAGRNGVGKNHVEAIRWYEIAAGRGHVEAMYSLGYMHGHGEGTILNHKKARQWHEKAAKKGHVKSMFALGWAYANGEGVPKDCSKAVAFYSDAAKQGYVGAQYELARLYETGYDGKPQNYSEAARLYELAADQGYARAKLNLGNLYFRGSGGIKQDYAKALKLYEEAAAQGLSDAVCNLGYMYEMGYEVDQSSAKAYELYFTAAEQQNASAQFNLGHMYENGIYVMKNLNEAKRWYNLAAQQGEQRAKKALERLKWK